MNLTLTFILVQQPYQQNTPFPIPCTKTHKSNIQTPPSHLRPPTSKVMKRTGSSQKGSKRNNFPTNPQKKESPALLHYNSKPTIIYTMKADSRCRFLFSISHVQMPNRTLADDFFVCGCWAAHASALGGTAVSP